MIDRIDTLWWHKLNGLTRRAIALGALNLIARPVVLTEYPKSGGSWISQMLSATLSVPYTRNRLPTLGDQILHGCFLKVNANLDTVVLWRDGRDTMISYYYHMMFDKPLTSAMAGKRLRTQLSVTDPTDVEKYLPRFIEWACSDGYPRFTWSDFVKTWYGNETVAFTSYESFLANTRKELANILTHFDRAVPAYVELQKVIESHSFEVQSRRQRGEEDINSFIRKGIAGDWMNSFNRESREIFHHHCGAELKLLGYAVDDTWVQNGNEMSTVNKSPG